MANPIDLERVFEELEDKLALTASIRTRLFLIHDFLADYKKEPSLYESYVHQLAEQIPVIEHPLNIAGADPVVLESIYQLLDSLFFSYPVLNEIETFQKAVWSLKNNLCFQYACLSEYNKATRLLINQPADVSDTSDITEWITSIETYHPAHALEANWLRRIQNQIREFENHSAYVPAVERRVGHVQTVGSAGGRLRKLNVTIERTPKGQDEIQLNVATFGPEQPVSSYVANPLHAARSLLSENAPGIKSHRYHGQVSFRLLYSTHEGSSASLAMAGLLYGAMLEASKERLFYRLSNSIGITGDITGDGRVLPVDSHTLPLKVEACFFSWLDIMVVPKSQLDLANEERQKLEQRYPHRILTIIGVESLRELFFDRRISKEVRISRTRRLANSIWSHKVDAAAFVLVLIMAGIIIALIKKPFDRNPVLAEYKGETMIIKNKEGQTLWKTRTWKNSHDWVINAAPLRLTVFFDVNGDGINDIIHIKHSFTNVGKSYLVCYDGSTHKILWTLNKKFDLQYPHKPFIGNDPYICNGMMLDTASAGPASLYLIETHAKYFPSMLLRIDPRTGKIKDTFVNAGHINSMGFLDINHSGKKEVIVSGVNNGYKQAFVAVLPHDNFHSTGPSTKRYAIKNYPIQKDIGYIRIPMTYLGKALIDVATFSSGRQVEQNDAGLIVKVNDANPAIYDTLMLNSHVLFQFDKTMHLISIGTNNAYDLLSRILKKREKIKKIPAPDYFVNFKDSLLYWDGKGWQHKAYLPFWKGDRASGVVDSSR